MKSILRRPRMFTIVILIVALVTAALRSLSFFIDFDPALGYHNGGILTTFIYMTPALVLIACAAYPLLLRASNATPPTLQAIPGTAARVCAPAVALACVPVVLDAFVLAADTATVFSRLAALGALIAIPYFVLPPRSSATAWFGLGVLLFCPLGMATMYFDHTVAINSPIKLWLKFSLLSLALYFLTELYNRAGHPQPLRSIHWGNIAIFLSISGGISAVAAATVGGIIPKSYLAYAILSLTLGIYTAARLLTATPACEHPTTPTEEA